MSAEVRVDGVSIAYDSTTVIPPLDLRIAPGEFVTLVGPSGCGKSTLLRAIAGFVDVAGGSIRIGDRDVTRVEAQHRGIGFVFQSYALFPQLTVRDNVAFGLKVARTPRAEATARIDDVLELTGLGAYADRFPPQLSGGQQQRVAIARVLVTRPSVLLMDEPLSNLDVELRIAMRAEIQRLHRESGVTTLYVTHDQEEALALSDRVAVLSAGALVQVAPPTELYERPETAFVASFIGGMNLLDPTAIDAFGLPEVSSESRLGVRPERMRFDDNGDYFADAIVDSVEFIGPTSRYRLRIGNQILTAVAPGVPRAQIGSDVRVGVLREDLTTVTR